MIEGQELQLLYDEVVEHFNTFPLGAAGRLVYWDDGIYSEQGRGTFIIAVHTTTPEKAEEMAQRAWDGLPSELRSKLDALEIGFALRMI